ncbi:hypothetical protein G6F46_001908 [Rhizopus delemar]|nr:hypothetical protein G6F43_002485 [Rhizopus delemar]KAG1538703.1 hypothetical protein G6F51_009603 [Rhizopus arrhizus]KAG1452943.1 hypothetical protein G6F55_008401 [Rhizopus delemar]KAG1506953.1 hypothetical protein G6F53_009311 [Rhizopus delemar]KAG1593090.1 hypothetical protein G6F48_002217 [Rhizopus delemar]
MQSLMCEALSYYESGQFKSSYQLYIQALFSAIEELGKLEFSVTENNLSPIFGLAGSCLNHAKQISQQHKKKTPPPLPTKPTSLSSFLPPPLPPRNYLNSKTVEGQKQKKGLTKASTSGSIRIKNVKPAIVPRRSSSPNIIASTFKSPPSTLSYNKDLFLMATSRIQTRVRAKCFTDLLSEDAPLIPQPPLDYITQILQQQEEFDTSFDKLRSLQVFNVLSILQFHPIITAYQLTLIDSAIFRNITPTALQNHTAKSPETSIVTSTDFFNYLTRLIEHSILIKLEATDRSQHLNYWIKVASRCHELKNYQTLKAVISALGTPPIQRLKQSWSFVPKKSMNLLEEMTELMSEASNYEKYRQTVLQNIKLLDPMVPFLGTFIHDMTYLGALHNRDNDPRMTELLMLFTDMQKGPDYPYELRANHAKEVASYNRPKFSIRAATSGRKNSHDEELTKMSIDLQQCLVTQYLLTRPWVNEKTVDELCALREPARPNGVPLTSSVSLTTTRSSSGSLTSSSTSPSRPLSLEDEEDYFDRKPMSGFWLFGRKSVDHNTALKQQQQHQHQSIESFATLHRSPRHFSFDEINVDDDGENTCIKKRYPGTVTSQSNNSLAIFRKEFWKNNNNTAQTHKFSLASFNSDPSLSTVAQSTSSPHPLDSTQTDSSSSFIWT